MRLTGVGAPVGAVLRRWADRIDPDGAPRQLSLSFTFEKHRGRVVRDDDRGCPLWYLGAADYERAWSEADDRPARINWTTMTLVDQT